MSVLPFFSIIIPTYARPEQLETCLRALQCLDYPYNRFEVIVVDDSGGGALEAKVGPFCPEFSLTLLRQAHAGPATARNTGAAHARGQFLAFTDDDCAPASDWLRTLAARVTVTPAAAVAGQTVNALPHNLYAAASQLFVSFWMTLLNVNPNRSEFWITSNLAVPADTFRILGGFEPTLPFAGGEDWELCLRWLAKGYQICYAPEVVVYHAHLLNLRRFWLQHFHYGRGRFRMRRLHGQTQRQSRKRSFLAASWQLLRYISQHAPIWKVPFLAVLIGVAQAANAVGVFWERRQQTSKL